MATDMCHAVKNTNGIAAASSKPRLAGIGITFTAGDVTYSAYPPSTLYPNRVYCRQKLSSPLKQWTQCPHEIPGESSTRSPGRTPDTFSPTRATSPAMSEPRICGIGIVIRAALNRTHKSR